KAWLKIPSDSPSDIKVFDITDPTNSIRIATASNAEETDVVIPDAGGGRKVLAAAGFSSVGRIVQVDLQTYDFVNTNFLIVAHKDLRSTEDDPVSAYANYRESAAGGSFNVQIANIDELYDTYSYGDPSPIAVRNFIVDASNSNIIESVFLIGKGFTPNFNYYRSEISTLNVPTYGFPGSDLMYGLGINSDQEIPEIPVGRLNATTAVAVSDYLDKVIEMEALPYDELWRKDFLQLSGGKTDREIEEFISIIQGFAASVATDFVGGKAYNSSRRTSQAVEFIDVTDRVNQGVGYVTFFGHSSGSTTDIEIGLVSDRRLGFSNQAKYPIFLVNGCQAGEIYGTGTTFGEDWMSTPNLGAIAFMAHSNIALSSTLKRWSDLFYEVGFGEDDFIGESIGRVILEVSRRYRDQYGTTGTNLTQLQQMTLQGDPALKLFGAEKPDYAVEANEVSVLSIDDQQVLATQDSFKINFVVRNFGRTVEDSLVVEVNRTLPDGQQEIYLRKFERTLRQDTLTIFIQNEPTQRNDGVNLFVLNLDPSNT
ncbi:MAG: hypothetical protein HRT61_24830, partial [Ekhidna sp.]|nr:hypothetical protein [Ekhidna sp.]